MSSSARDGQVVVPDQTLWLELSSATDDKTFGEAWLTLACRMIGATAQGVLLLMPGGGRTPVLCGSSPGKQPDAALLSAAHATMQAGRGTVQPAPHGVTRLAYPVQLDGTPIAAAAFDIATGPGSPDARQAMRQVQWAAAWLRDWRRKSDTAALRSVNERTTLALDLLAASLEEEKFAAACRVAVTELATRFGCERVSIGFSRRHRCSVVAISHTAQFGRSMSLVKMLAEAMDEAVDQRGPVLYPSSDDDDDVVVTTAHAALSKAHGSGIVLTVPLFVRDRFVGAAVFERGADQPMDQSTLDLADATVAILGPALLDKREAERAIPLLAVDRVVTQAVHLFGPGHWGRKLTLAALVLVLLFCAFARGPYRISADARVEGAVQRAMVAPFDGFLATAAVRAGDTVHAGDMLASLDDRDLALERLRYVTEQAQHLGEYDQALSQGNRADAARYRDLAGESAAQIRLVDEELQRTRIIAPFDGVVVSGDLSQSIGTPVRRGDTLFEIAPLHDWRVVLQVPESQVADVVPNQTGSVLVSALPELALPFTVLRVVPVAEAHDGKMLFRVDAALDATTPRLRPGMEGVGQIDAGRSRLAWIWFRSLLHWVRLESWAWLP